MEYHTEFNPRDGIVETTVEGDIDSLDDVQRFAADVAEMTRKCDCHHVLHDLRRTVVKLSTSDIFTAEEIVKRVGLAGPVKRALVIGSLHRDGQFYETVLLNRGHFVKLFTDLESAREWLLRLKGIGEDPGAGSNGE